MSRPLLFFSALLLLFCGGALLWFVKMPNFAAAGSTSVPDEEYRPPEKEITSFEFKDQLGKPFGSKDLRGRVWLGSFFFADCPSICVEQNARIAQLHRRLRDRDVMIINITVTPDKDPPHRLWDYANRFEADHASWKFLTGKELDYVRQVGNDIFGLPAADETHTSHVAVFDREGRKHDAYNVMDEVEYTKLINQVEELLGEVDEQADVAAPATSDT